MLTPKLRYVVEDGVSADYGLAADEFLMRAGSMRAAEPESTLRLYTYRSHCALVGRFQNIEAELDLDACRELDVQVSRRPTGGGAILMGADQLGLCFTAPAILDGKTVKPIDVYRKLSQPVVRVLAKLGIQASFRPKNDLEVNGKKIAGLGVYYDSHGALLFHTSLLVDLDVSLMLRVLRIPAEKIADKADVRSVAQRVTTVRREAGRNLSVEEIREAIKEQFEVLFDARFPHRPFTRAERRSVEELAGQKYRNDAWIFQRSPLADMTGMSLTKTAAGLLRTYIALKGQVIKSLLVTGDFFQDADVIQRIEASLKWNAFDKETIREVVQRAFSHEGVPDTGLLGEDVVTAIWKAGLNARAKNRLTNKGSCYYPLSRTPVEI